MLPEDIYKTIETAGEGIYSEKKSKFLAFALPVIKGFAVPFVRSEAFFPIPIEQGV